MLLQLEGVSAGYGGTRVCERVSLALGDSEIVCVIGRNGVGKTTLMRAIIGLLPVTEGVISLGGKDITAQTDYERALSGIGYVPQGRMVFKNMTVAENLLSGTMIGTGRISAYPEKVFEYFPILKERLGQLAGTLSGGQQQMLALARALSGKPRLLLLDEPSEGIQPSIVAEMAVVLRRISQEEGLAILLVEQNLKFAQALASRGYVMEKGRIVAQGDMAALVADDVVQAHLALQ